MAFLYFLLFAPAIMPILLAIIAGIFSSFKSSSNTDSTSSSSKPVSSSGNSIYRGYGNQSSLYDCNTPDYNYYSRSSMESEMQAHNARMEQLIQEQNKIMIDNESRRISESIQRPLSDMFDTRLTNIFRNPWEGIL